MGRQQQGGFGLGALRARFGAGAVPAARLHGALPADARATLADGRVKPVGELARGDVVVLTAGDIIPADGVVIEGMAWVEESAITGESAPVIRESGTDRCAVTGGCRLISDRLVVEIS